MCPRLIICLGLNNRLRKEAAYRGRVTPNAVANEYISRTIPFAANAILVQTVLAITDGKIELGDFPEILINLGGIS